MRPLLAALFFVGCQSNPGIVLGYAAGGDTLELDIYGVAAMASVEVCGVKQADRKQAQVPHACLVTGDMLLAPDAPVTTRPVPIVVKPILGSTQRFERTLKLDIIEQRRLLEGALAAVAHGVPLTAGAGVGTQAGIVIVGDGALRSVDAKRVSDVGTVVRVVRVNERETGRTCSYTGLVDGKLFAYDVDVEAFDARTTKSLGKGQLVNDAPTCPATNYGNSGDRNSVASAPSQQAIVAWLRSPKR